MMSNSEEIKSVALKLGEDISYLVNQLVEKLRWKALQGG